MSIMLDNEDAVIKKGFDLYQARAMATQSADSESVISFLSKGKRDIIAGQIVNAALGMGGEGGEVEEHIKKVMFHGRPLMPNHLANETGDLLWYCAQMGDGLMMSLGDIALANLEKLRKRYPEGFDSEKSVHENDDPHHNADSTR